MHYTLNDFISLEDQDYFIKLFTSGEEDGLRWLYSPSTAIPPAPDSETVAENFYFCAPISESDESFLAFKNLLEAALKVVNIKYKEIKRIRCNYDTRVSMTNMYKHHTIHVDSLDPEEFVFIYYVMDSDGDTILFDENKNEIVRVHPLQGTGVIFPASMPHAGSSPVYNNSRAIINFNFTLA